MSSSIKNIPPLLSEQNYNLSKVHYLSKNIIYISHFPESLFSKDILYQKKFLGQYGHINQMILLNHHKNERSVIVQFDTVNQAALAILSLHNFKIDENTKLKAIYFISKYCYYFLNKKNCPNPNCLFLHEKNINNYLLLEIKNNKQIDSYKFALEVLNLSKPIAQAIGKPIADHKEYLPPTKFQNSNILSVSMPNSDTFSLFVDNATKWFLTASFPKASTIHFLAVFAFVIVSSVVNVFEATIKRVVSGSNCFNTS